MSHPLPAYQTPVSKPPQRTGIVLPNAAERGSSSLCHEFCDTVHRLLQHLIFILLLSLRLYMLPLLYILNKLETGRGLWYSTAWQFVRLPGAALAQCTRCCRREEDMFFVHTWPDVWDGIAAPLKIFKALYSLGKILEQNPSDRPSRPTAVADTPDSAIDPQSQQGQESTVFDGGPGDSRCEESANASQIYHAALLNGSTLDDILAALEKNKATRQVQAQHITTHPGEGDNLESRTDDREMLREQVEARHYRASSIQKTPERMLVPKDGCERSPCSVREEFNTGSRQELQTPENEAPSAQKVVAAGLENSSLASWTKSLPAASQSRVQVPQRQNQRKRVSSVATKRCPTFMRRQNQGDLPARSTSTDKGSLAPLHGRTAKSSPALSLTSPTKRSKLQRKVMVYQDQQHMMDP
ncbi:hypothetical protein ABEF95_010563 [Exophiala dermatitidis]